MTIEISEVVETVGWNQAVADAPKDVVEAALKSSNNGIPTVMGKIGVVWVVVQYNPLKIVYRQPTPTATT